MCLLINTAGYSAQTIKIILENGLVSDFLSFLKDDKFPILQHEALLLLRSIFQPSKDGKTEVVFQS